MYIPKLYRVEDREKILLFLRQNNFAALVSHDANSIVATHMPLEVSGRPQEQWTIYGHMSRANAQWKSLAGQEVLVIFQGPNAYVSPRWYNHINVPTWNYMIVHVYGLARIVDGAQLESALSRLVKSHEAHSGYRLETLPADFVEKEIRGIVGFAVDVERVEASYKLSQNRDDESHANVIHELEQRGDENARAVAKAMRGNRTA